MDPVKIKTTEDEKPKCDPRRGLTDSEHFVEELIDKETTVTVRGRKKAQSIGMKNTKQRDTLQEDVTNVLVIEDMEKSLILASTMLLEVSSIYNGKEKNLDKNGNDTTGLVIDMDCRDSNLKKRLQEDLQDYSEVFTDGVGL
ncbi:uncharacterized protein VNE69_09110 [Vairimorpha necatrix]|uniref:Uncharacterized protein n=1 Tax=Vairimorpha necatrix TaxID=6039 RepID=A0AAX4JEX5_9MICR